MGINVNYSVSKPNHKRVKVVMNEQYDWAQLDRLCDKDTTVSYTHLRAHETP